jgi:hypothetical protein
MNGVEEILLRLDAIEVIVIKMASTVSVLIFCFYMTRSHIRRLHNSTQKKPKQSGCKSQQENKVEKTIRAEE